jgi:D,D-heptose 1,7-bisphosphate phosphatase
MVPVLGRPVLEHLLALCMRHRYTRIALLVHHEHDAIRGHFGDGHRFGVELSYHVETEARGTAGALRDALPAMSERFLVLYGDTYADVDLQRVWQQHVASGAAATLLLHPNDHPYDSDLVEVDAASRVLAVHAYPHPEGEVHANLVNAALYVMEREGLAEAIPAVGKADLAKHTFPAMLRLGKYLHAVVTPEYIKDMGTPERLDKVERDIVFGLPQRLSSRQRRSAVFLDRDGTLNEEVNHLRDPVQLRLIDGAAAAVRVLNRVGRLAVCVTNQPVVARGDLSVGQLARIHASLDHQLGRERAYLDRLYYCPHHPDRGYPGEVAALKMACDCRKPGTGMIDRAVAELAIARADSWMVGDATSDIRAGNRAGLRTALVRTGQAGRDAKYPDLPDYVMADIGAAVDWIVHGHPAMARRLLPVAAAAASARLVLIAGLARAGKSCAARVLAELLAPTGRTVHVVCADGWLRPPAERPEGVGVLQRYDVEALGNAMAPLFEGSGRHLIRVPLYDRDRRAVTESRDLSVAPEDLVIVEGVIALMVPALREAARVRVQVEADDAQRHRRLQVDYAWRQDIPVDLGATLLAREVDEVPAVRAAAANATHRIPNE